MPVFYHQQVQAVTSDTHHLRGVKKNTLHSLCGQKNKQKSDCKRYHNVSGNYTDDMTTKAQCQHHGTVFPLTFFKLFPVSELKKTFSDAKDRHPGADGLFPEFQLFGL